MNNTIKVGWEAETIDVILTPEKFPTAYENKVKELLEQEVFKTREEAEKWVLSTPIQLELIYECHSGLFAVESEAIPANACISPYSGKDIIEDE